jgi:hypothetical protein
LLTRMTGISLHMQWPLTSQLLGNCFFPLWIKLHAHDTVHLATAWILNYIFEKVSKFPSKNYSYIR